MIVILDLGKILRFLELIRIVYLISFGLVRDFVLIKLINKILIVYVVCMVFEIDFCFFYECLCMCIYLYVYLNY